MRPIPGSSEPGETAQERVAELIARAARRREANKALREQMNQRRAYGLRARHAAKDRQPPAGPHDHETQRRETP